MKSNRPPHNSKRISSHNTRNKHDIMIWRTPLIREDLKNKKLYIEKNARMYIQDDPKGP
jgi:hypothetical protein